MLIQMLARGMHLEREAEVQRAEAAPETQGELRLI